MSILTGPAIVDLVERSRAVVNPERRDRLPFLDITPFNVSRAGPNSYDVCLAPTLMIYDLPYIRKTSTPTYNPSQIERGWEDGDK